MKVDLLIIDYPILGFVRYGEGIARALRELSPSVKIAGCYFSGSKENFRYDETLFDSLFCAQDYGCDPERILNEYRPKAILTLAHRICDYMFTISAHRHKIMAFNFQHGLYQMNTSVSKLTRVSLIQLLRAKREKIGLYMKCLFRIAEGNPVAFGRVMFQFLRGRNLYAVMRDLPEKKVQADVSFIYGHYWESYYRDNYLETETDFRIAGYPELEGPVKAANRNVFSNPGLPVVCYLAQTSVEDATLARREMDAFLQKLEAALPGFNLLMKFHPRSDRSIYRSLLNDSRKGQVAVWEDSAFPVADGYIGHESTVLARAMYLTNRVLIARLREDRISLFEAYADYVCGVSDNLGAALTAMMKQSSVKNGRLEELVVRNGNGALKETAQAILEAL